MAKVDCLNPARMVVTTCGVASDWTPESEPFETDFLSLLGSDPKLKSAGLFTRRSGFDSRRACNQANHD